MGSPHTPEDKLQDVDHQLDATLADGPVFDLDDTRMVDTADEEFERLILENQLEESDASAPGLEIVSPEPTAGSMSLRSRTLCGAEVTASSGMGCGT